MTAGAILNWILYSGATAAVAYWLFQTFSSKWLDAKFAEKMEAFRHEKAKELERLRIEIDGSLDAVIRMQDREFKVLSEAWELLQKAYGGCFDAVSPYQTVPDLGRMSETTRLDMYSRLELSEDEIDRLNQSDNTADEFYRTLRMKKFSDAKSKIQEFKNYMFLSELFLEASVAEKLKSIGNEIHSCLDAGQFEFEYKEPGKRTEDGYPALTGTVHQNIETLGTDIRRILRREQL